MKNILKALYNGELDYRIAEPGKKYEKQVKAYYEKESKLTDTFTKEQCVLYDEYREAEAELDESLNAEIFTRGFRCGAKIVAELFADSK